MSTAQRWYDALRERNAKKAEIKKKNNDQMLLAQEIIKEVSTDFKTMEFIAKVKGLKFHNKIKNYLTTYH